MEYSPILVPVVALVAWSMIVMIWMFATRGPAMRKAGLKLATAPRGLNGARLDQALDERAQWKAHNYNHLMEQPTLFYAICIALALMGAGSGAALSLAWTYVGLRVLHSLVQGTVNIVLYRFSLFFLASLCLLGLTICAILAVIQYG